ncbi:MAG: hypothetical protein RLZZ200_3064, partial [Pseudomonadota bacterium]
MPYDPRLGYDPSQNVPPEQGGGYQTREQWVADLVTSLTLQYVNGQDMTQPFMASAWFQAHGLAAPPTYAFGIKKGKADVNVPIDPGVSASFTQLANYLFDNWNTLDPASKSSIVPPTNSAGAPLPRTGGPGVLSPGDQAAIATATQAGLNRAESARQFDLTQAEGRRQFNANYLLEVTDRAAKLAANPVDWIAHAYFLANMGIPQTIAALQSSASLFGAIPASGPSAAGPMIGGPAALDGDRMLAEAVGTQPQLVSVSQAVQMNPGDTTYHPEIQMYGTPATAQLLEQHFGGLAQADQALSQARTTELPQAVQPNEVIHTALSQAPFTSASDFLGMTREQVAAKLGVPPVMVGPDSVKGLDFSSGVAQPITSAVPGQAPKPGYGPVIPGATPAAGPAPDSYRSLPAVGPGTNPNGTQAVQPNEVIHTVSRGPYTGNPVTTPTTQGPPIPGGMTAGMPQGEAAVVQLANLTGIPADKLRSAIPPDMLAGGYSLDTIANHPAVVALRTGASGMSAFNTGDPNASRFSTIQAFGIPVGIRGGQDINAGLYARANPSQR